MPSALTCQFPGAHGCGMPYRPHWEIFATCDIKQGLENFKRVPSAHADIKIVPANSSLPEIY